MHNMLHIKNMKGIDHHFEDGEGLLFLKAPLFDEDIFESASLAVFEDEVHVIGGLQLAVVLDEVGALHRLQDVDLGSQELSHLGHLVHLLEGDRLDREFFSSILVVGPPNLPELALTNHLGEDIVLDHFAHLVFDVDGDGLTLTQL